MRVIMLSWEYPPKIVGGLSRHVYDLSHALADSGIKVDVITGDFPDAPTEETEGNLSVYRVNVPQGDDFVHWVHNLNAETEKKIAELLDPKPTDPKAETKVDEPVAQPEPTVIHAHDWLSEFAGKNLKHKYNLPLVATIHATEHGRNHGINNDIQRYISGVEWDLCYEAWRVICCSHFMKDEINSVLGVPYDKLDVIANGVDGSKFDMQFDREEFRKWFAQPNQKLILFVGRMVPEKGVQVLIQAMPDILGSYNDAKLIVVGGGNKNHLIQLAEELQLGDKVFFTGYVDDDTLLKLYNVVDVAVYPSLYEPFGIVALEAMVANVPVVVSDVGGLREVVDHGVNGLTAFADNPDALAWAILRLLKNPYSAQLMAENAYRKVLDQFNWGRIAEQTTAVYDRVWSEYMALDWGGARNVGEVAGPSAENVPGPVADPEDS